MLLSTSDLFLYFLDAASESCLVARLTFQRVKRPGASGVVMVRWVIYRLIPRGGGSSGADTAQGVPRLGCVCKKLDCLSSQLC